MQGYVMDQPVVDKPALRVATISGWTGRQTSFNFSPGRKGAAPARERAASDPLHSDSTADGEAVKAPADVMVMDRLEKPSEN